MSLSPFLSDRRQRQTKWRLLLPLWLALAWGTSAADAGAEPMQGSQCGEVFLYRGKQLLKARSWREAQEVLLAAYAAKQDVLTAQRAVWISLKEVEQAGVAAAEKDSAAWHRQMLGQLHSSSVAAAAMACRKLPATSDPESDEAQQARAYLRDVCNAFQELYPGTTLELDLPAAEGECAEAPRWALRLLANQVEVSADFLKGASKSVTVQLRHETKPPGWCGGDSLGPCIVTAVGAAAVLAAIVPGAIAWSREERMEDQCPNDACPDASFEKERGGARNMAKVADVLWVTGSLVAVAGLTWYGGQRLWSSDAPALTAACSSDGCLISAVGSF